MKERGLSLGKQQDPLQSCLSENWLKHRLVSPYQWLEEAIVKEANKSGCGVLDVSARGSAWTPLKSAPSLYCHLPSYHLVLYRVSIHVRTDAVTCFLRGDPALSPSRWQPAIDSTKTSKMGSWASCSPCCCEFAEIITCVHPLLLQHSFQISLTFGQYFGCS